MTDAPEADVTYYPLDVNAIDALNEWAQSWQSLCNTARKIEEDCIQEYAWLRSVVEDSDSENLLPNCSEYAQCLSPDVCWLELVRFRSQVHALRQIGEEPELVQNPVDCVKAEPNDVNAKLQEYKEKQRQELLQIETDIQESEISLISIDTFCESFATSPHTGIVRSRSAGSLRPQSAGSLRDRKWRGPCGGDGSFYQSGHLPVESESSSTLVEKRLNICASPLFEKRLNSKVGLKNLIKNDEVLNGLRNALQSLDDDIKQHASMMFSWPSADHEAFMRVFRIFRRQSTSLICDRLVLRFPNATRESIESHLNWCVRCEEQQAMKRELLSKWRERIVDLDLEAAKLGEKTLKDQGLHSSRLHKSSSETQRKQVEEWRRSKEEAAAQAAALEQKLNEEKKKREKAEKKKCAQERSKEMCLLKEFQMKRAKSVEELRAQACKRNEPLSPHERNRIGKRTAEMLKKRIEAFAALQPIGRCAETEWKNPKYACVPSRLYEPTVSWTAKVRSQEEFTEPELEVPSGIGQVFVFKEPELEAPIRALLPTENYDVEVGLSMPDLQCQIVELGLYQIVNAAIIQESSELDSKEIAELQAQEFVKVLETKDVGDRVRARIESPPGWISLRNKTTGLGFALKARAEEVEANSRILVVEKVALEATVAEQSIEARAACLEATASQQSAALQTLFEEKQALKAALEAQVASVEMLEARLAEQSSAIETQTLEVEALEDIRRQEELRLIEEKRIVEERAALELEQKRWAEQKAMEEVRREEELRLIEEKRIAEERALLELEQKRLAEQKALEEVRRQEELRLIEEQRIAEERRVFELEQETRIDELRLLEDKRIAEERLARELEEKRLAEEEVTMISHSLLSDSEQDNFDLDPVDPENVDD